MPDNNLLFESARAAGIFAGAILLAWLIHLASRLLKNNLATRKGTSAFVVAIDSAVSPVVILIAVEGLILALMSVSALDTWRANFEKASMGAIIAVATYGLASICGALITRQLTRIKERATKPIDLGVAMFLKRIAQLAIYAIGLLFLLDYLGIPISPLIASLGIGGLAVALALQPTLGNFFAGTQVISDRVARVGDFIEIDDKTRGYVTDVGWRSTRIRTPFNNIIIIPNSIIASSQVTNYNLPNTGFGLMVNCGVSYDSDLAHVKKVALEVANEVIQSMDEAIKTFEPGVGFDSFGDSNVMFWIWVQAKDRLSSFSLKSELIMRLHARFKQENITINYPVRVNYLRWPPGTEPQMPGKAKKES